MADLKSSDPDTESAKLRTLPQGPPQEKNSKYGFGNDYTDRGTLIQDETTHKDSVSTSIVKTCKSRSGK